MVIFISYSINLFFINAFPEPVLRYFSNFKANSLLLKAIQISIFQDLNFLACFDSPALCFFSLFLGLVV